MDAREIREYIKGILEEEFDDAELHYQGKRIVVTNGSHKVIILVTNAKIK